MKISKHFFIFLLLNIFLVSTNAQDVIILQNADEIQAKVLIVNDTEIIYKKWNNLDGPQYQLNKNKIFCIKYENGTKDVFGQNSSPEAKSQQIEEEIDFYDKTANKKKKSHSSFIKQSLFNTYWDKGMLLGTYLFGTNTNFVFGGRINEYVFVGGGIGTELIFNYESRQESYYSHAVNEFFINFPIYAHAKAYYPVSQNFYPFIETSIGYATMLMSGMELFNQLKLRIGIGIDYKRLSVAVGYDMYPSIKEETYYYDYDNYLIESYRFHAFYLKVGMRLGKLQ